MTEHEMPLKYVEKDDIVDVSTEIAQNLKVADEDAAFKLMYKAKKVVIS